MSNETLKQHPCENCDLRKGFAKAFDMHFWGKGCPYKCDEYEDWKCRTKEVDDELKWRQRKNEKFSRYSKNEI